MSLPCDDYLPSFPLPSLRCGVRRSSSWQRSFHGVTARISCYLCIVQLCASWRKSDFAYHLPRRTIINSSAIPVITPIKNISSPRQSYCFPIFLSSAKTRPCQLIHLNESTAVMTGTNQPASQATNVKYHRHWIGISLTIAVSISKRSVKHGLQIRSISDTLNTRGPEFTQSECKELKGE